MPCSIQQPTSLLSPQYSFPLMRFDFRLPGSTRLPAAGAPGWASLPRRKLAPPRLSVFAFLCFHLISILIHLMCVGFVFLSVFIVSAWFWYCWAGAFWASAELRGRVRGGLRRGLMGLGAGVSNTNRVRLTWIPGLPSMSPRCIHAAIASYLYFDVDDIVGSGQQQRSVQKTYELLLFAASSFAASSFCRCPSSLLRGIAISDGSEGWDMQDTKRKVRAESDRITNPGSRTSSST